MFHAECVGTKQETIDGRLFDSMENQIQKNGDAGRRLVVKMDVEGAEWESLSQTSPEVLDRIDQLIVEFHLPRVRSGPPQLGPGLALTRQGVPHVPEQLVAALQKIKERFHVANLHYNNYSCSESLHPVPAQAFEVLFVNKRVAEIDPTARPTFPNPLDMPNNPAAADCQVLSSR
jgi:hypothetical protein